MRKTRRRRLQTLPKMQHLPLLVLRIRVAKPFKRVSSEVPNVWGRIQIGLRKTMLNTLLEGVN